MSFYHTLFVKKTVDTEEHVRDLEKYMYLKVEIPVEIPKCEVVIPIQITNKETPIIKKEIPQNVPVYTLFWAIYIAINGYEEYASIGRGYSNREMGEKQKIIETIQKSPTILKQTNQKMTKDKMKMIMSDVMSGRNMGLSTLPAFASVYNKRIIVICKNRMRIDVSTDGAEETIVIRKNNKDMFSVDLDANVGIIERETFCFHQIEKPLRAISTYKMEELTEIAGLLDVPVENKKKPELYVELVQACI